jgi:hypothetical protein
VALLLVAFGLLSTLSRGASAEEDPEIKLGRESAAENDKQVKLITDKDLLERVNKIGSQIAAVANEMEVPVLWGLPGLKKLPYTFKIVDDKDVNAYSMPGGFIYVNRGLLDFTKSDDELAGVIAHEVAHAAHHHMMKLIAEQDKIQWAALGPALVSILLGKGGSETTSNLLLAGQLYTIAKMNGYGVEAEKDADHAAVYLLMKTPYNPVGLLTFIERLARQERLKPEVELGIYRTHPPTLERAQALIRELTELGIPINRREVDPTLGARVEKVTTDGGVYADVVMNGTRIVRLADNGTAGAEERAKTVAKMVNTLFDDNLLAFDLSLSSDKTRVLARRRTLIALTDADARASGLTVQQVAQNALDALRNLLWQDQFNRTPLTSAS